MLSTFCSFRDAFDWNVPYVMPFSLISSSLTSSGLPAQAKKHAEKARNTLLTWKRNTTSDKEKKEILETLVILYYTLGIAWLLQNQYPFFSPKWIW